MKRMMKKALRVLLKVKMMTTKSMCQDSKKSYQDGEEINHQQPTNNSFLVEEFSLPPDDDDT